MRALPFLLALLVALLPLSAAQEEQSSGEDSSSSSSSSSSTTTSSGPSPGAPCGNETSAEGREACKERFCRDHPNAEVCQPKPTAPDPCASANTTQERERCVERFCATHPSDARCPDGKDEPDESDQAVDDGQRPIERWCASKARDDAQAERCERYLQEFRDGDEGDDHWVTFRVDEQNISLLDVRVGGRLILRSLHLDTGSDNVTVEREGRLLRIGDNDTELAVHDDPVGLLRFKGDDGAVTLRFPAGISVQSHPEGFRIHYAAGHSALLLADNATWIDNVTVEVFGFAAFHVPVREDASAEDPPKAVEAKERVQDAIERRHVAAEISLKAPESEATIAAAPEEDESVQVLTYDDIEVDVDIDEQGSQEDGRGRVTA